MCVNMWHRMEKKAEKETAMVLTERIPLNNTLLPRSLLGRVLDEDVLAEMERCGIDLCGENGEYHTLVVDGPVFHKQVAYQTGKILDFGEYSLCDIF